MIPPVYAIYCEELPEARDRCEEHLRSHGIRPTWWRSFHAQTWGLRTVKTYEHDRPGTGYTIAPAQVGLLLGHYSLWQHLYHAGVEVAMIVEDDVVLVDDFERKLDGVLAEVPDSWGLLWAGILESAAALSPKITAIFGEHLAQLIEPYGTHCYLVRREALPVLLEHMAEARAHIDIQLFQNVLRDGLIDWYACIPSLAGQVNRPTD